MDWYAVLSIDKDATAQEIRRAYRQAALKFHPDKNAGVAEPKFDLIGQAYKILSDPEQRAKYDKAYNKKNSDKVRNVDRQRLREQLREMDIDQRARNQFEQRMAESKESELNQLKQEIQLRKNVLAAIMRSQDYQNPAYRELSDGSMVFDTITDAREYVDKNPSARLKKSWLETEYHDKLENAVLNRIMKRAQRDLR